MIQAFEQIIGVGRYANFSRTTVPKEQQAANFQRFNFIYGDNGTGKTTLTHILRSLKGEDAFLLKKRTFGRLDSPKVLLTAQASSAGPFAYDNFQWQAHLPNLEIFDVHFINNNVYTGLEIQNNHKKKLFEIILGDNGVRLKKEIQDIKIRIQNGNKIVRTASRELESMIQDAYTALEYANLSAEEDIEEKIKFKKQELDTAKNHQTIQAKAALTALPTIQLPFDLAKAEAILSKSLDFISAEYLEKFKAHKAHLKHDQAEEWLQQGFAHKYDDKCPFCLQKIDDSIEILQAYQQYFNDTYKQLVSDIQQINSAISDYNLNAILLQIENVLTINHNLVDFWKTYLTRTPNLLNIETEKTAILAAFDKLKVLFQQKVNNPIQAIPIVDMTDFGAIFTDLSNKLTKVNENILDYNESIAAMKAHGDTDTERIDKELAQLQAIAKRGNPDIVEHCDNLIKYTKAIAQLKAKNEAKKEELNRFKNIIFHSYLTTINRHLTHFAPYLSLKKLTSGYQGSSTEPVVKFALCVHGKEVVHKEKADRHSMKYTLSEGDKNALALAFFLAKLESDDLLSAKIIVFDDAVSSFDRTRQSKLLDQLIAFGQQGQQLFFLTHDLRLGQEFVRRVDKANLPLSKCRLQSFNDTMNIVKQ